MHKSLVGKGKLSDEDFAPLLEKFKEMLVGNEVVTTSSAQYQSDEHRMTKKTLDFRALCHDNNMDPFGGEEVHEKIDKMIGGGFYTKKPLKAKEAKKVFNHILMGAARIIGLGGGGGVGGLGRGDSEGGACKFPLGFVCPPSHCRGPMHLTWESR
jgi:hypothetical protein